MQRVSGVCFEGVWKVSGRYLKGVWKVSEKCMLGILVCPDTIKMVSRG